MAKVSLDVNEYFIREANKIEKSLTARLTKRQLRLQ